METNLCVETPVTADVPRNTVKFTLCITGTNYSYNCAHSLGHKNRDKRRKFNAFHTVVLRFNLLENRQTQQIYKVTDYRVFFIKFNRTTCFGLLRPSSGPKELEHNDCYVAVITNNVKPNGIPLRSDTLCYMLYTLALRT